MTTIDTPNPELLLEDHMIGPSPFDDEPTPPELWRVRDDQRAQRVARKMRQHQAEIDRVREIAAAERLRIDEWEQNEVRPHQAQYERWEGLLEDYRRFLDEINPDLAANYTLPDAVLKRLKGRETVEVTDVVAFSNWADSHDMGKLVRVKVEVDKAGLKAAALSRSVSEDGRVVTLIDGLGDGHPVPGVHLERGDDTIKVTLTKDQPL